MRVLIESLPGHALPDVEHEAERQALPLLPPDDDDFIRPAAEEELLQAAGTGGLAEARSLSLAKHLLWTFGPDHRALPFLLQLRAEIEGDRVVSCDPEVGWLHQGIEKSLEGTRLLEGARLVERLHPANPVGHQLAWLLALERLCAVDDEVPRRAQLWRVVMAEVSRILEHLRVLSDLVLLHAGRRAQRVFATAEKRVAALLEGVAFDDDGRLRAVVGGLSSPVPVSVSEALRRGVPEALSSLQPIAQQQQRLPGVIDALRGLGAVEERAAVAYGFTGPALRACGLPDDVRVRDPYFAYGELAPRVPTYHEGDARARFRVRLDEVFASSALVLRALAAIDDAPAEVQLPRSRLPLDDDGALVPPAGTAAVSVELAGGELSLLVVADGTPFPRRARLRTPSFPLASALSRLLVGARLDEVVPVLISLGMIGGEIDR